MVNDKKAAPHTGNGLRTGQTERTNAESRPARHEGQAASETAARAMRARAEKKASEGKKRAGFRSGRRERRSATQTPAYDGRARRERTRRGQIRRQTNMDRLTAGRKQQERNALTYPGGVKKSRYFIWLSMRTVLFFPLFCPWITASATHLIVVACPARGLFSPFRMARQSAITESPCGTAPQQGGSKTRWGGVGGCGGKGPPSRPPRAS